MYSCILLQRKTSRNNLKWTTSNIIWTSVSGSTGRISKNGVLIFLSKHGVINRKLLRFSRMGLGLLPILLHEHGDKSRKMQNGNVFIWKCHENQLTMKLKVQVQVFLFTSSCNLKAVENISSWQRGTFLQAFTSRDTHTHTHKTHNVYGWYNLGMIEP